jgi:hypothetical protein
MKGRVRWSHVTIALALIAALAIAAPAIGGPSLKQLVKKEVAKQIAKATGPAGPAGPPGANGANGANGVDGIDGADGVDGTARAYAQVFPHSSTPCTAGTGGNECTFTRSKGVTRVTLQITGWYCVTAPGIHAADVSAAVTVDWGFTGAPEGNASAMEGPSSACGDGRFLVVTERQPQVVANQGSGTVNVSGLSSEANNVGFTIVIP